MNKSHIPKFATKLQTWLIFATAVFGFYAGAAALGLEVPRPAWIGEHRALAGEVRSNRIKLYRDDVRDARNAARDARIARSRVNQSKRPELYESLLSDEIDAREQLRDAKEALSRARTKK